MSNDSLTALTTEIDRYLAEADALKYGDPQALLKVAQSATTHAQTLGDFRRYASALGHQAWAYGFLNQYELSLEQRRLRLQRITTQVQWMTVMLDDILDILQLDEGDDTLLVPSRFQLDELAQAALQQMDRYRISNMHVRIHIQPGQTRVHAASEALQTVLVHLLSNAVKFSRGEVLLELGVRENTLVMQVADQGIGIQPEEQKEVFKPLVRGSNLDEVTGNGLGLAIVTKLVEQMHGKIDLDSRVGTGTTITVSVPLA